MIAMDFFVAALVINRSMEMFASALGTWIPFATSTPRGDCVETWHCLLGRPTYLPLAAPRISRDVSPERTQPAADMHSSGRWAPRW